MQRKTMRNSDNKVFERCHWIVQNKVKEMSPIKDKTDISDLTKTVYTRHFLDTQ